MLQSGFEFADHQVCRSPGGCGRSTFLSIVLTAALFLALLFLLVFFYGGCSVRGGASSGLLPPLAGPLPPAVSGRFGQRMMDVERKVAVICSRIIWIVQKYTLLLCSNNEEEAAL